MNCPKCGQPMVRVRKDIETGDTVWKCKSPGCRGYECDEKESDK